MDKTNDTEDDWAADIESNITHSNGIVSPECPMQQEVTAAPNFPGLIRPSWESHRQVAKVLVTVNAIKTRRNTRGKNMYYRIIRVCTPVHNSICYSMVYGCILA